MLDKNKSIKAKTLKVIQQFHTKITLTNKLGFLVVEFIESYDNLISLIKLLHLAACFESDEAYYVNLRLVKKMGNRMLSRLFVTKTEKCMRTL